MALSVFFSETTSEGILALLTIASPGLPPIRCTANNEPVTSRGQTFEPYPFNITLPTDATHERPRATLEIDNVSPEIMEEVRRLLDPPDVKIELVLMSTPNVVEKTIDFLRLTSVTYDALTIRGDLQPVDLWSQPAIAPTYTPVEFPGLAHAA